MTNLFGNGPDTPAGVRGRAANSPELDLIDDATIEQAIVTVRRVMAAWEALPIGGRLNTSWPLDADSPFSVVA